MPPSLVEGDPVVRLAGGPRRRARSRRRGGPAPRTASPGDTGRPSAGRWRGSARRRTCRASGCRPAGSPSRPSRGTSRCRARVFWNRVVVRLLGHAPSAPGCCAACSAGRPRRSRWPGRSGCRSLAERSSRAAEFTAPAGDHHDVGAEPRRPSRPPSSVTTAVTVPARRVGLQPRDVGVGDQRDVVVLAAPGRRRSPGRRTCASSRQGKPSTRSQRMQTLSRVARPCSSWVRCTPIGRWNGCRPCFSRSSLSCWIRGSCSTGG